MALSTRPWLRRGLWCAPLAAALACAAAGPALLGSAPGAAAHEGSGLSAMPATSAPTTAPSREATPIKAASRPAAASAPNAAVVPITGNDARRLAEQAAFGPTPELVAEISAQGSGWIDAQLRTPATGYAPIAPVTHNSSVLCPPTAPSTCYRDNYTAFPLQNAFFRNALTGKDQLRQRVALAYSQIFVVSSVQIGPTYALRNYQQMLLEDAFVNFRQLLGDVTLSPVMGDYLDMVNNNKGNPAKGISPNENYAREVMQLFSIGPNLLHPDGSLVLSNQLPVPAYTQDTVEGYASLFTGWTYPTSTGSASAAKDDYTRYYVGPMAPVASEHDEGTKLLLGGAVQAAGQSPAADLAAGLDSLYHHPNVGPFLGKQLIQFLVTSNPSPAYVARVAAVFNDDGRGTRGNMGAVVKAILLDPEARGGAVLDPAFGKLREPAVDVVAVLRALGARSDGVYPNEVTRALGQPVFSPQTVFSFYSPHYPLPGSATLVAPQFGILNTTSALARLNFVNAVAFAKNGVVAKPDPSVAGATGTTVALPQALAQAPTSADLVALLNTNLLHGSLPAGEANLITAATNAVSGSAATLPVDRAHTALYLVLASPRYQVTR